MAENQQQYEPEFPVLTSNVKHLIEQVNEWWSGSEQPYPAPLGLVVGASGTGKTVAVQSYLLSREPEQRTRCAFVHLMPSSTQKSILASIFHQLDLSPRGRSFYEMASQLQDISQQGQPPLLMFDDADYFLDNADHLKSSHLEILSTLVKHTSCFILLVGTPKFLTSIETIPPLDRRVGLRHYFGPLSDTEMYEVFLPQLVFPGWDFHPTNDEDFHIGKYLWENAKPSLRRVCMILDYASSLVQMHGSKKITFEDISMAVKNSWKNHRENEEDGRDDESTRH